MQKNSPFRFLNICALGLATLIGNPVHAVTGDWFCAMKNPWGNGYSSAVRIHPNGDGTSQVIWKSMVGNGADGVAAELDNFVATKKANCFFKGPFQASCIDDTQGNHIAVTISTLGADQDLKDDQGQNIHTVEVKLRSEHSLLVEKLSQYETALFYMNAPGSQNSTWGTCGFE